LKTIVAIGGAVIKTAWPEIKAVAEKGMIDLLIHNGASIFHDFQMATDTKLKKLEADYYTLDDMLEHPELAHSTAKLVWDWLKGYGAPPGTLTRIMESRGIRPLMFTAPGCDFWHLSGGEEDWRFLSSYIREDLYWLIRTMKKDDFHYICMGSAVIHPEIFKTALAMAKPKKFEADVVDFLDMYRPKTRVSRYGKYYHETHKEFLEQKLLEGKF
jgi:hypothetical protein